MHVHAALARRRVLTVTLHTGALRVATYLLDRAVDVNAVNKLGCTALHAAVFSGAPQVSLRRRHIAVSRAARTTLHARRRARLPLTAACAT